MVKAQLQDRMKACGITLTDQAAEDLCRYHDMLMDYNTRLDLTAVTDENEMLDRHYVDSLMALTVEGLIPKGAALIDIGTGAGFPGLPLAIARGDLTVTLLDALNKRVAFLNDVIAALGLKNVRAVHMRAEDAAQSKGHREQYDVVVARAVANLPVLLEYTLPFAKVNGKALYWKGPAVLEELNDGKQVARLLGGEIQEPFGVVIPERDWQHLLLPVKKVSATLRQYPRKSGTPQKQPLHSK